MYTKASFDVEKLIRGLINMLRALSCFQALSEEMKNEKGKVYPLKADLEKEEDIIASFKWIESNLKTPVHILVNNAGLSVLRDTVGSYLHQLLTVMSA